MADAMRTEFESNITRDREERKNELAQFMQQKEEEI